MARIVLISSENSSSFLENSIMVPIMSRKSMNLVGGFELVNGLFSRVLGV